jgi:hypothetical protein
VRNEIDLPRIATLFVMTNCKDNSCRAQFSLDGTPVGPDSTDTFTNVAPPD